jgi:O-antigen/teichoic acid export membrane protein
MTQSRTFKAVILGSGQFLVTLTGLISAAVLSRIFTKEDYAAYRQTLLAYAFVAPLLTLGLPQALYYFIPRDRKNSRSILTGNLLLLFLMGGIFTVAMWCGGNQLLARRFSNPAISQLLLIYSPYAMLALPISTIGACLMSCDRVKTLAIYSVGSGILTVVLVISLVLIWQTPKASISAMVLAELLIFVPAIILMYRATAGTEWHPSKTNLWEQVKYSIPLGLAGMLGIIALSLDKIIVSSMCTPEQFAVYVNGAAEIPLIGILTGSVTSVLLPDFVRMYKASAYEELRALWHRAMIRCLTILLPVMAFILVMAPEIMRVLFSTKYEESAYPFRVYSLMLPVRATTFGAVLMAINRTRAVTLGAIFGLLSNFLLSILFVKFAGPIGAAWATVGATYGVAFLYTALIARYLNYSYKIILPWKEIACVFAATAGPILIILSISSLLPQNDIVKLMIVAGVFSLLTMISYRLFRIVTISDIPMSKLLAKAIP